MTTEHQNDISSEKERALQRVRKMLALANDAAATEGERDNALRMAHSTLAKWNLSIGEAEAAGATKEKRTEGTLTARSRPWIRTTAHAIAQLFFCEYFYVKSSNNKMTHYFIGREANIVTAREMTAYVTESILREARKQAKMNFADESFISSFCKGAAHRVSHRCYELRKAAEQASAVATSTGTSLVLASHYATEREANKAYIEATVGKLKSSKNRERGFNGGGYAAGRDYGDKVNLSRQIGGSSNDNPRLK